jgi:hypothetical protein
MAEAIFQHFNNIFGAGSSPARVLDFDQLLLPQVDLSGTDSCLTEEEVWSAICAMPADKAPGLDGFSG